MELTSTGFVVHCMNMLDATTDRPAPDSSPERPALSPSNGTSTQEQAGGVEHVSDGDCRPHLGRVAIQFGDRRLPPSFWRHVQPEPNSGCWLWTGAVNAGGYGWYHLPRNSSPQRMRFAHRVSVETFIGQIPDGFHVDHLCRTPSCCNPSHLEPVTPQENTRRGRGPAAASARQKRLAAERTHCPKGHAYADHAFQSSCDGRRRCRLCSRDRVRRFRDRTAGGAS